MPADLATLSALKARVEETDDCMDRDLDAEIVVALEGGEIEWRQANFMMDQYPVIKRPSKMHTSGFSREPVPCVTASLDASIGAFRRALPGWEVDLHISGACSSFADVRGPEFSDADMRQYAQSKVMRAPALAVVHALLTAKIARLRMENERSGALTGLLAEFQPELVANQGVHFMGHAASGEADKWKKRAQRVVEERNTARLALKRILKAGSLEECRALARTGLAGEGSDELGLPIPHPLHTPPNPKREDR